ncbi:MAG: endo alpha-1,4 polygalactosaminidase, partial [Lachnospiraceae bacterium]|nr:endo alpha-1,4 polygalactosaminidase [Lachnospiraceae bacterium]
MNKKSALYIFLTTITVLLLSIGLFACNRKSASEPEQSPVDVQPKEEEIKDNFNACDKEENTDEQDTVITKSGYGSRYGVFLSYEGDLRRFADYDEIVIDAQYFTKEQITEYKKGGHKVYSYLNIGSLETFRPYYNEFVDITLSDYENWEEERW